MCNNLLAEVINTHAHEENNAYFLNIHIKNIQISLHSELNKTTDGILKEHNINTTLVGIYLSQIFSTD